MLRPAARKLIRIVICLLLLVVAAGAGTAWWLSRHYKSVIIAQVPEMVQQSTDSLYHVSFSDIDISLVHHSITLTGVQLQPDHAHADALRARHHRIPPTLSTISIPKVEAYGFSWSEITTTRTINFSHVIIHDIKWLLDCRPHPEDSLFAHNKKSRPLLSKIAATQVDFINPDVTYKYHGSREHFAFYFTGGAAILHDWVYNTDEGQDTSLLLYAHSGKVRFDDLVFVKKSGRYTVHKPDIDFETTPNSVTLKNVRIKNMINHAPKTGLEREIYNISLPAVRLTGFNWNRLIMENELHAQHVEATEPQIAIRYFDKNDTGGSKMGSFPHQLLLQVGMQTNLENVHLQKANLKYTEVTEKNEEAVIEFTGIDGHLKNVTNVKDAIAANKICEIKLSGKYMNKSDVTATFRLNLLDTTGRFSMDGVLADMNGDDVLKQAQTFTIAEVTSFHLDKMDMHIEGDDKYAKGNFTVLYRDLKISLLKFKSKHRMGKKGPLSFLGSTLILYPSNPLKDKPARTVTTSFARDPDKGFIGILWQHIFRAAKKTAVRHEGLLEATDVQETSRGEDPKKKGFLKRLFGKKDK